MSNEITRRSFLATGTVAAAGSIIPRSNQQAQTNFSKAFVGFWTKEIADRLYWKDAKTAFLKTEDQNHEGPVFKFPARPLNVGECAVIHITSDACFRRGEQNHRPAWRIVVRVKPGNDAPRDGGSFVIEDNNLRGCYIGENMYLTKSTWTHRNNCVCSVCVSRMMEE